MIASLGPDPSTSKPLFVLRCWFTRLFVACCWLFVVWCRFVVRTRMEHEVVCCFVGCWSVVGRLLVSVRCLMLVTYPVAATPLTTTIKTIRNNNSNHRDK